jgi:murein DD-endopeptidase MepM/ murein hydrolase activator NlpD
MKNFKPFGILLVLGLLISQQLYSQTDFPKDSFRSPMDIPLVLAGNFAELRSNHFHTGLDIKTNSREGYKLYSIEDGYISRINISHWGYGLCMYVKHPNGYTSVYAHCSAFPESVEEFVKKAQKKKQTETITLYPGKEQFPLKKGDLVAYSGNSGSSTAPHLHFEIRDSKTEEPLNPLLFGFDIKDDIPPSIFSIKVYGFEGANISGGHKDKIYDAVKSTGSYKLLPGASIEANGKIGFSVNTIDRLNIAPNKCGVFTIDLYVDEKIVYQQKLDRLNFYTNRYINAHMDYEEHRYKKQSYHKSFKMENNKLPIYGKVVNDGFVEINDNLSHAIKYVIKDAYGNSSELKFKVKGNQKLKINPVKTNYDIAFDASSKNQIIEENFKAYLPKGAIYEDASVTFNKLPPHAKSLTQVFDFHTDSVPLQKYFVLKMKLSAVKENHKNKVLIAELSDNRRRLSAKGGTYKDGWVTGKVRSFGNYMVMIDTINPWVTETNITNKKYKSAKQMLFKVSDNLSGVDSYKVFVDGEFFHSYYTPKSHVLRVPLNGYNKIEPGAHKVVVEVIDERKNKTELKVDVNL